MEVKSYKCDICGTVYHVEECDPSFVVIETSELSDDILKQQRYTCLCPKCQSYIKEYIGNPAIAEKQYKNRRAVQKLEDCLRELYNKVSSFHTFWYGAGVDAPEYYDGVKDQIIEYIDEKNAEHEKRINTQLWTIRVLSCLLGICIGAALAQLI